jgi:hypothetical protein
MTDKEKTTTTSTTTSTPKPKAKESKHVEFLTNELAQVEARLSSAAAQLLHSQDQVDSLTVLREALKDKLKQIR